MTETDGTNWYQANQRYLMAEVALVRDHLERYAAAGDSAPDAANETEMRLAELEEAITAMPAQPALASLTQTLGLSDFEQRILVLCAGMELDGGFASLCATAHQDSKRSHPTFGLALAALPDADWSAVSTSGALRHWLLIDIGPGDAITTSPLRIDESILCYLTGVDSQDERLAGLGEPMPPAGELVPSHTKLTERLARVWVNTAGSAQFPVLQLCGGEIAGKRSVAAAVTEKLGLVLRRVPAVALPTVPGDLQKLNRLWNRESLLDSGALLLDCDEVEPGDAQRDGAVSLVLEGYHGPLFLTSRKRRAPTQRPVLTVDIEKPEQSEQREVWCKLLGDRSGELKGQIDRLVSQFDLSVPTIRAALAGALGSPEEEGGSGENEDAQSFASAIWETCRNQVRPRLDDLAKRISNKATWDELVLPAEQCKTLRQIASNVRQKGQVYERWGFSEKGDRGLGVSALFAGISGTGKTMAAEVLATDLALDLYRIDLSSVVSKYIGETEKNLARVFDAAEEGSVILLFDEADALFGKRSEIKDSHDRYANVEVSYLLQRMESYRGLAILTTNMRDSLDAAFLRRLRFIVEFPFPRADERAEIWQRTFPPQTETEGLDIAKLARLSVAGGSIRNIALGAAFLAAEAGEPVRMEHLLEAAKSDFAKVRKPFPDSEVRDWT
ncbi:MAG: ATP-binding protein [Thermoanaerobaculia bacterium]